MYLEDIFDIPELTDLERETQACVVAKIAFLEERLAKFAETALAAPETPALGDRVEAEMTKAELAFWRTRDRRELDERDRVGGPDAPGFFIVPARASSRRALRLAHGYTDLADISASPLDRGATLREIALAVRIAIEEDGVPVMFDPGRKGEVSPVQEADAKQEGRKVDLERLRDTETALVAAYARLAALEEIAMETARAEGFDASADWAAAMKAALGFQKAMARKPYGLDRLADAVEAHVRFYRPS